jgi:hypothetical protein
MAAAVEKFFGDLAPKTQAEIRTLAEESLVLYATGTKARPCLSFYDAGEGQLASDFPMTFCSLVYGTDEGSYKGAVNFVQGRFNMGGTGVLPFCGDNRKVQLIVSRVPSDVDNSPHEWAFTFFCFFPSKSAPSWKYLIGSDGNVMTAGSAPLGLVPKLGAKSGELCAPREREVPHGTLIKMYDYKAPKSNICGELFRKLEDYLIKPALPLRVIECRPEYRAKVMGVTIWDRLSAWAENNELEEGFEDGASFQLKLSTDEPVTGEIRVFKLKEGEDKPQTGLRVLINGQSHAKRDASFFETGIVDKEHVANSMLVTLDCTALGQTSRNMLFMSNREHFRDDPLVKDLLKKVQKELREHEGLKLLNQKRYEQKIANATKDADGINAIEEMLSSDPLLAAMFGSMRPGKVASKTVTAKGPNSTKVTEDPTPFKGKDFPTFFKRANGATVVTDVEFPRGSDVRISFLTDVKNNYFSRSKNRGACKYDGLIEPALHLFNGRLTFTFSVDKKLTEGTVIETKIEIADSAHGPFNLVVKGTIAAPRPKTTHEPKQDKEEKTELTPSSPEILEAVKGPNDPPITIETVPNKTPPLLALQINKGSQLLIDAKKLRKKEEHAAVEFVFKYGLALVAMGLLEAARKTPQWETDRATCKKNIQEHAAGVGRVIVPLCLTLPQKLPQKVAKAA